jgi:hypothetical protein
VKEATRQTLIRRSDEPKLEIGDTVLIKEGLVGVVLAPFLADLVRGVTKFITSLRSSPVTAGLPVEIGHFESLGRVTVGEHGQVRPRAGEGFLERAACRR